MFAKHAGPALVALVALSVAACGDDAGSAAVETVTVEIGEFVFDPTPVEVRAGDSVVWVNTHDQDHRSSGNGDRSWDTGNIPPGGTSDPLAFAEAGTFSYICGLHPFMEATVEVTT